MTDENWLDFGGDPDHVRVRVRFTVTAALI